MMGEKFEIGEVVYVTGILISPFLMSCNTRGYLQVQAQYNLYRYAVSPYPGPKQHTYVASGTNMRKITEFERIMLSVGE